MATREATGPGPGPGPRGGGQEERQWGQRQHHGARARRERPRETPLGRAAAGVTTGTSSSAAAGRKTGCLLRTTLRTGPSLGRGGAWGGLCGTASRCAGEHETGGASSLEPPLPVAYSDAVQG